MGKENPLSIFLKVTSLIPAVIALVSVVGMSYEHYIERNDSNVDDWFAWWFPAALGAGVLQALGRSFEDRN